jgi:hypothetical protein
MPNANGLSSIFPISCRGKGIQLMAVIFCEHPTKLFVQATIVQRPQDKKFRGENQGGSRQNVFYERFLRG